MPAERLVWLYPKLEKPMGGTNFVLFAASALAAYGEVLVIGQTTSSAMAAAFGARGVELRSLGSRSFTDPVFWLRYRHVLARDAAAVRRHLRPGDRVVSSMYPMNVVAARAGRHDVQILYEPFSFFFDPEFRRGLGALPAAFFRLMAWRHAADEIAATQAARRTLTLSRFEAERIARIYGVEPAVIYEGVDTGTFHPGVTPSTRFAGRRVILHSTGFDRYKGTDLVIRAMGRIAREVPDALLVVTWTREDPHSLRRYRRQLRELGAENHVAFLGTVPFAELPGLYRRARVYVEPGAARAMSLSVKEAMACGTPVVRGADGREEVEDGVEGFLVDPDDSDGFAERTVRLLLDDELHKVMASGAVRRIERQFTWRGVARRIAAAAGVDGMAGNGGVA